MFFMLKINSNAILFAWILSAMVDSTENFASASLSKAVARVKCHHESKSYPD